MARKHDDQNISKETYRRMWQEVSDELRQVREEATDTADQAALVFEAMESTLDRTGGYYRVGKARNGTYWVRFKWTSGPYAEHYVIGGHASPLLAFLACLADTDKVEAGKRTPLLDGGYRKGSS